MLAEAVTLFYDIEARRDRVPGERFEVDVERLDRINAAGYGELARAVEGAPEASARKPRARKAKEQ